MYSLIAFGMAVFPALWLVHYFNQKDKRKPEPKYLIISIFVLGLLSTIPVIFLEIIVGSFNNLFSWSPLLFNLFKAFVVAGFCEEFIKLKLVQKFAYKDVHFDEVMDGIIYAVVASLGFACLENILYVMQTNLLNAVMRAFTAVPMHAVCSGLMGYHIGLAKFSSSKIQEENLMRRGLWVAIFLHGLYDFLLFISPYWGVFYSFLIFPLLLVSFKFLKYRIRVAVTEDEVMGRS
ncbi:MAG: PrsW family intramembrane metalloprotease [Candidatus Omnitrophica bacterium]|nr:PrsW family intramembrane metalloprotease [Candidatus Omnitrophota bacterium]